MARFRIERFVSDIINKHSGQPWPEIISQVQLEVYSRFNIPLSTPLENLPPRLREAVGEPSRRHAMADMRELRRQRRARLKSGKRRDAYRRVIFTKTIEPMVREVPIYLNGIFQGTLVTATPGRELHFHATKGWRTYRRVA